MPPSHHRTSSASSDSAKPPSVFRYTLILLKARPSVTDLSTISSYAGSRSAPVSPTELDRPGRVDYFNAWMGNETPPPYSP